MDPRRRSARSGSGSPTPSCRAGSGPPTAGSKSKPTSQSPSGHTRPRETKGPCSGFPEQGPFVSRDVEQRRLAGRVGGVDPCPAVAGVGVLVAEELIAAGGAGPQGVVAGTAVDDRGAAERGDLVVAPAAV